jgi:hypothetical protein
MSLRSGSTVVLAHIFVILFGLGVADLHSQVRVLWDFRILSVQEGDS